MLALRYASLLALSIWVGGLVALGAIAAPAIFEVIGARGVGDGRMLSGAVFGEVLRRFHLLSYGCGALVLATLTARAILGPRPRRFAIRTGIAIVMLAVALYSGIVVSGRIETLRTEIGVAPSSLPETDPRRAEFGRLHRWSTALQIVPLAGGLLLMLWELRD
ncbi:MAG TPA: DUF4149 domain-containing protein [Vicinamibacterales bacterium]|nr:DUF4149 domain-containing protein [Vicinamibacterales bacterium]